MKQITKTRKAVQHKIMKDKKQGKYQKNGALNHNFPIPASLYRLNVGKRMHQKTENEHGCTFGEKFKRILIELRMCM